MLAPEFCFIETWLGKPGNTWECYRSLANRGAVYQPDQDVCRWVSFNLLGYIGSRSLYKYRLRRVGQACIRTRSLTDPGWRSSWS